VSVYKENIFFELGRKFFFKKRSFFKAHEYMKQAANNSVAARFAKVMDFLKDFLTK